MIGENFPYTNFHDLNTDWLIKIAKDFLDQYTHIQEIITQGESDISDLTQEGLEQLQEKKETLEGLLQDWYDTHSSDIANQLASALSDIQSTLTSAISTFNANAALKLEQVLASIPDTYDELNEKVDAVINKISTVGENIRKKFTIPSTNGIANYAFIPQTGNTEVRYQSVPATANLTAFSISVNGLGLRSIKPPAECETVVFLRSMIGSTASYHTYEMVDLSITNANDGTFYPIPEGTIFIGLNCVNVSTSIEYEAECTYLGLNYKITEQPTTLKNPLLIVNNRYVDIVTGRDNYNTSLSVAIFQNDNVAGYIFDNTEGKIASILCASSYDNSTSAYIISEAYETLSKEKYYVPNNFFAICVNLNKETSATISSYPVYTIPNPEQETVFNIYNDTKSIISESFRLTNGIFVMLPDASNSYNAFWMRDYAMSINSPVGLSDVNELAIYNLIKSKVPTTGEKAYWVPDHILMDGNNTPVWRPGAYTEEGGWGYRASLDGAGFLVDIAYHYFKHTNSISFVSNNLTFLKNCIDSLLTGYAVYVTEGQESCAFGFYDTVKLHGYITFTTIQAFDAYNKLAEMAEAAGINFENKAPNIKNFFNTSGKFLRNHIINITNSQGVTIPVETLYIAPSDESSQNVFDVWSTAYAIKTGILTEGNQYRCCLALNEYTSQYIYKGMAKHVPTSFYYSSGQMWQSYFTTHTDGEYQDGGFWPTPMNWITEALKEVDNEKAKYISLETLNNCSTMDYPEWINISQIVNTKYCTSVIACYDISNS